MCISSKRMDKAKHGNEALHFSTRGAEEGDWMFKANLGYTVRSFSSSDWKNQSGLFILY